MDNANCQDASQQVNFDDISIGRDQQHGSRTGLAQNVSSVYTIPVKDPKEVKKEDRRRVIGCIFILCVVCVVTAATVLFAFFKMDTDKTNSEEKAKDPEMNVTQTYHGTFAITFIDYMAAEYLDEYDNPDTPQYQVLEQNITNMLHETYVSVDQFVEFLYSELLDVRNGSIIVDFMLVFKIKRKNYQLSIVELKQVLHHTIIVGDTVFQIDTDSIVITEHITTLPPTTVESTVLPVTITFPPPPPPPPPPPFTTRAPPSTITTMQTETSVMTTMRPSTPGRTARVTTQPPTTKTTTESTSNCHPVYQFACNNGQCKPVTYKCDGYVDCEDGSDEGGDCVYECAEGSFLCPTTFTCVSDDRRCDGFDDCGDLFDEKNCTCDDLTQFSCLGDGLCIPKKYLCDDVIDCEDSSDELECGQLCPDGQVVCRDRSCISELYQCNGRTECPENEDESICVAFGNPDTANNDVTNSGIVYVRADGSWMPLCSADLEDAIMHVVCRQMGFREATGHKTVPVTSSNISATSYAILTNPPTPGKWINNDIIKSTSCPSNNLTFIACAEHECGRPLVEEPSSSRIVGGTEATRGVWPWQVSLSKSDGGHICGASVLTNNWIVTAAHCFKLPTYDMDTSPGPWQAAFGIQDVTLSRYRIERRVKAIYVHPDYHPLYDDYDIAMVELVHPIEYNDYIMPICLPTYDMRPTNESTCYVTGWGATSEHGFTSDVLKQALLPVVPNVKCDELLATDIGPRMLCAGYDEGGTDACQGDSGGPFVCQKEAGDWYLAGVVSHGFGCARPNSPGVYSRVTEYLDYIYQFLQQ